MIEITRSQRLIAFEYPYSATLSKWLRFGIRPRTHEVNVQTSYLVRKDYLPRIQLTNLGSASCKSSFVVQGPFIEVLEKMLWALHRQQSQGYRGISFI